MKRRILLVDDDVAVLLTFKAVLEISGFEVDTAASAREGKARIRSREYHMVISDMRMENDAAGAEVIQAARTAPYHPAVALLTAFPVDEDNWEGVGPDKILVKATHTRVLLQQIEKLFTSHSNKLAKLAAQTAGTGSSGSAAKRSKKPLPSLAAAGEDQPEDGARPKSAKAKASGKNPPAKTSRKSSPSTVSA
jgi:DNA-binding response OmpR family regulator